MAYWLEFWYIFPVALAICITACVLAVEGAVFFTPALLFLFPALHPAFPALEPFHVITLGLVTELVGYSSSATGYLWQRRVDLTVVRGMVVLSVPLAVAFGFASASVPSRALLLIFAGAILAMGAILRRAPSEGGVRPPSVGAQRVGQLRTRGPVLCLVDRGGHRYLYPSGGTGLLDRVVAAAGGTLVGLIGVGVGPIATTRLIVGRELPVHVATATSAFIVALTVLASTASHILVIAQGGAELPWNLAAVMALAVLLGGQIAPRLAPKFSARALHVALVFTFFAVGSGTAFRALS